MKKLFASFLLSTILFLTGWCVVYGALTDNITSYWKMEEESGARYDAVVASANDLTDNNTVTRGTGIIGYGASFDAANLEYLSYSDASDKFDPAGSFSFNFWVKVPSSVLSNFDVISKYTYATGGLKSYLIRLAPTNIQFYVTGNSTGTIEPGVSGNQTLSIDTWYMITCVFTSSTRMEIFVNSSSIANNTTSIVSNAYNGTSSFIIGGAKDGAGTLVDAFTGTVDETVFWNKALTQEEITALYKGGLGCQYPFTGECVSTSALTPIISNLTIFE